MRSEEISQRSIQIPLLSPLTVKGDFIMIRHPVSYLAYLYNWRNGSAVALNFCVGVRGYYFLVEMLSKVYRLKQMRNNTMHACLTSTHVLATLHIGTFTLLAIPLSSLEGHWSEAVGTSTITPLNIDLEAATESEPFPPDTSGLDILRVNLSKPRMPSTGPWVVTMHSFVPVWRACSTDVTEEIFIVGFEKTGNTPFKDRLLSWRIQLSRSSYRQSHHRLPEEVFSTNGSWRMAIVDTGKAPAEMLPQNDNTISNAGIMLSYHKGLSCFQLFCDSPQPTKVLPGVERELIDDEGCYSLGSMDPYSRVLAMRTQQKLLITQLE